MPLLYDLQVGTCRIGYAVVVEACKEIVLRPARDPSLRSYSLPRTPSWRGSKLGHTRMPTAMVEEHSANAAMQCMRQARARESFVLG